MNYLSKFKLDLEKSLFGETPQGRCVRCKDPFTSANVFTPQGERETHISKLCERCWNEMFK